MCVYKHIFTRLTGQWYRIEIACNVSPSSICFSTVSTSLCGDFLTNSSVSSDSSSESLSNNPLFSLFLALWKFDLAQEYKMGPQNDLLLSQHATKPSQIGECTERFSELSLKYFLNNSGDVYTKI